MNQLKTLMSLNQKVKTAEQRLNYLDSQIKEQENRFETNAKIYAEQLEVLSNKIKEHQREVESIRAYGSLDETGLDYSTPENTLNNLEEELAQAEEKIGNMIDYDMAIRKTKNYLVDGSDKKGEKFQRNYGKNLLIGMNAVYNKYAKMRSINFDNAEKAITNAQEKYNRQAKLLGIYITNEYRDALINAIKIKAKLKQVQAAEKERIRKERQRMKEQEKLLAEAEKERKRLEEERKAMDIAFAKALTDTEREEIKSQLEAIDKRIADIDYRVNNQQAGYLYVISSPSLDGMVKIGCTRRLNPTIRVKELSSSSLPFPFVTHGFVFSDDCFELESNMHKYFNAYRVHPDREFFYITPKEVIDVLKNEFHCEVHFEDLGDEEEQ